MTMAETVHAKGSSDFPDYPPLHLSRMFHARRETLFAAWGSAEHLRHWFAPEGYDIPEAAVELRVGGVFQVCMRAADGSDHWTRGTFVEVRPHDRLVIDMYATDPAGRKLFRAFTEVKFFEDLCGSRMEVTQSYTVYDEAAAAPMICGASEGWSTTLDRLEAVVLRMTGAVGLENRSVVHATFHLERTYDAPLARVWRALTDTAAKAKRFGPQSETFELLERHMDIRIGGRERLRGRWQGGVVSDFDAIYHDVVPDHRLVYSYVMHLNDKRISASLATVQLAVRGGGTSLAITEQGAFLDGYDDAGSREHGTNQLLDLLGASLLD
jgi:uncharacterized protein YndB with AHSA1/START domain